MVIKDEKQLCWNCNEKDKLPLKAFCCEDCRKEWNINHPGTMFGESEKKPVIKFCPNCKRLMKQFFDWSKGEYFKCTYRKCGK